MPRSELTEFGNAVALKLFMAGLTQADLANKIGCSRQYLHRILSGERSGMKYISLICDELGMEKPEEKPKEEKPKEK